MAKNKVVLEEEEEIEDEPKKEKKDIICRSCGNEFSSKKVKITKPCPYCKQASLEKKI